VGGSKKKNGWQMRKWGFRGISSCQKKVLGKEPKTCLTRKVRRCTDNNCHVKNEKGGGKPTQSGKKGMGDLKTEGRNQRGPGSPW